MGNERRPNLLLQFWGELGEIYAETELRRNAATLGGSEICRSSERLVHDQARLRPRSGRVLTHLLVTPMHVLIVRIARGWQLHRQTL